MTYQPNVAAAGHAAPVKPSLNKSSSRLSPAALSTVLLVAVFAIDAFFGDTLWAKLTAPSSDAPETPTSLHIGTRWWCVEWTFCAWLLLMGAWCSCVAHRGKSKSSKFVPKLHKGFKPSTHYAANIKDQSQEAPTLSPALKQKKEALRAAIEQAAREGKPDLARSLLLKVEEAGLRRDHAMPNMVMRAYTKNGDMRGAEQWLKEMKTKGFDVSACTYNTIMDACAKTNKPELCETWLSRMIADGVIPNAVTFTTAIYAHAHQGAEEQAEAMLVRMKAANVEPDAVCYNALIHACSIRGNIVGVERWVNEMETQGIQPSVTTYTAAIDACAKQGEVTRAEAWMERLLAAGLEANVVSYSSLMDACAKAGNPERAGVWYERMIEVGVTPNSHSFSAAISACARRGDAVAAEQWLARAQEAGVASDPVLYSGVIDACGKANDADRAWGIFEKMRARGVRPHIVLYAALARPFAHRGNWKRVEEIAAIMEESGVASNEYFLYAHLLSYCNARPKEPARAEATFKQAMSRGVKTNDHVLTALARSVGRPRATALAAEGAAIRPYQRSQQQRW